MKVSNKMKIISMAAITIAAIVTIACANVSNPTNEPSSTQQWQKKYPQVFSNVGGYQKLFKSNISSINNKAESNNALITNQLGIYDKSLDYIITTLSQNPNLLYATIRLAQINEKMYLSMTTESAVFYANQAFVPLHCMNYFSKYKAKSIYMPLINIYMANAFYKKQINNSESLLNLKILGTDKTKFELDQICVNGAY